MKKQTSVGEKQYQSFDTIFNNEEKEEPVKKQKKTSITTNKSSLVYDSNYSFSEYRNVVKYYNLSFTTKHGRFLSFDHGLKEFRNFASGTEKTKIKLKKRLCIIML